MKAGKISYVDLHPRDAVEQALSVHHDTLAVVGRDLDAALQSVAARYDDIYPELQLMPNSALAANLRLVFGATTTLRQHGIRSLRFVETPLGNDSIHLYDAHKRRIRIRKRPTSVKLPGAPLPVSPAPDTLDGPDFSLLSYEVAVLWEPDYKAKSMRRSVLAAVENLDDWGSTQIYYELPLPLLPLNVVAEGDSNEDRWGDEEGGEGEAGVGPS